MIPLNQNVYCCLPTSSVCKVTVQKMPLYEPHILGYAKRLPNVRPLSYVADNPTDSDFRVRLHTTQKCSCKTHTWIAVNEMSLRVPKDTGDNTPIPLSNGHNDESIYPTCAALAGRVDKFLETEASTDVLKAVQEQTRIALRVIGEALERYRYFLFSPFSSLLFGFLVRRC